jgi:hypothetical protein
MMEPEGNKVLRRWPRWESIVGALSLLSLASSSGLGHQLPMIVQRGAFLFLVGLPFILATISWVGFNTVKGDEKVARWRVVTSFCGCVALSLALIIPFLVVFFTLDYTRWTVWILGPGVVSLLAGIFAPRSIRFSLLFGGLIMSSLVVMIPVGIL